MLVFTLATTLVCAILLALVSGIPPCKTFEEIYGSGEELCNTLWGESYQYSTDYDTSYTMWYFDDHNPNDNITMNRGQTTPKECIVQGWHHKRNTSQESAVFTECHPWQAETCCLYETVKDIDTIIDLYGKEWRWDRCGPLTSACERFFVQEACFWECDPNIGLFHLANSTIPFSIYRMPMQAKYCDSWYRACRTDMFCAEDDGNYFSCAREWAYADNVEIQVHIEKVNDESLEIGLIVGVCVAVGAVVLLCAALFYLRLREKRGQPIFQPMLMESEAAEQQQQQSSEAEMMHTKTGTGDSAIS